MRKRRKATKMVVVVVILFATFWLPIHVFQLWFKLDANFPKTQITYVYKICAHSLSYANCCVNPFVYSFLGDGFRKAIRKAFPRLFRPRQVRGSQRTTASSHILPAGNDGVNLAFGLASRGSHIQHGGNDGTNLGGGLASRASHIRFGGDDGTNLAVGLDSRTSHTQHGGNDGGNHAVGLDPRTLHTQHGGYDGGNHAVDLDSRVSPSSWASCVDPVAATNDEVWPPLPPCVSMGLVVRHQQSGPIPLNNRSLPPVEEVEPDEHLL